GLVYTPRPVPDRLSEDLASLRIPDGMPRDPDSDKAWRLWAVGGIVLLGLVGGGYLFAGSLRARLASTEVDTTEARLASPAQASVQLVATGFIVAQTASKVGAKLEARVAEVKVREGSRVKVGDVIVLLDAAEPRAALASSRARLAAEHARADVARANLAEARRQYEREKSLLGSGAARRAVVEDLEARVASLAEQVRAADAEVEVAKAQGDSLDVTLGYATIRAPIAGVVVGKPVEVGELVGPQTAAVAEIADFASLVVEADVPEGRLHQVRADAPAEIVLDAYPMRRHRGVVSEVSPRVNRAKATVVVKVQFVDEAPDAKPDMAARVNFLAAALDRAALAEPPRLVVPASAVVERGGTKVVFRIEEGRARLVPVTLGEPVGDGFVVLAGPREGHRLVANPPAGLGDGDGIRERMR
ncbi:MAG: efflux RND transporter periplasmic adaptor subunit, partial [Planctomycetales bacterium]|nr:efflux RND transporter periplasmic adaptor subunit [Planctomycetales bacterium]